MLIEFITDYATVLNMMPLRLIKGVWINYTWLIDNRFTCLRVLLEIKVIKTALGYYCYFWRGETAVLL